MKIGGAIRASLLVSMVCGVGCHREIISTTGSRTEGITAPTVSPESTRTIEVVTATPGGTTAPVPNISVGVGASMQTTGPDGRVSVPTPQGDQTPFVLTANGFHTFETLARTGSKFAVRSQTFGDIGFLSELHRSIIRPPDPGRSGSIALDAAIFAYAPGRPAIDRAKDQLARDLGIAITVTSVPEPGTTLVRMSLDPSLSGETGGTGSCDAVGYVAQGGTLQIGNLDYLNRGENSAIFVYHELLHAMLCFGHTTAPGVMNPATMYTGTLSDANVQMAITTMSRGGRLPGTCLDVARGLETDRVLGGIVQATRGLNDLPDMPPPRR